MPHWHNQPWQRNLSKTASGKTGAVQDQWDTIGLGSGFCAAGLDRAGYGGSVSFCCGGFAQSMRPDVAGCSVSTCAGFHAGTLQHHSDYFCGHNRLAGISDPP